MDCIHLLPFILLWTALPFFKTVESSPVSELEANLEDRAAVDTGTFSVLSSMDVTSLRFYTYYASTAYCQPTDIMNWTCGRNCMANPWFHPIAAGGDGAKVQIWYVGYDILLRTVIVGHQGTDPKEFSSILTDSKIKQRKVDNKLFPGLPADIRIHDGFIDQHEKIVIDVFAAVKQALNESQFKNVTVVGHSLGGALALISALYLPTFFPNAYYRLVTYGMPRVGNKALARYLDNSPIEITRITNKKDPIPTIPGIFLGFQHPKGEKHIQTNGAWLSCPGNDNRDKRCSRGEVSTIISGRVSDHAGPYDGIKITCKDIRL